MGGEGSFKDYDRFIRLEVSISAPGGMRGLPREKTAEKAGISRSPLSMMEASCPAGVFSLEIFYDPAGAPDVDPAGRLQRPRFLIAR